MNTLSESKVHRFNLNTLRLDKELEGSKIDLLLMPGEIQKRAVVAAQWHTAMDRQVCPLCNSLQGEIIPVDSPEWGRIFPPIHLGCFLSSKIPILTSDGHKGIGDIVVDDRVLTHKGRFRRVLRLFRQEGYQGSVIELDIVGMRKFTVTPEHPFLTKDGWKMAGSLGKGDSIMDLSYRRNKGYIFGPLAIKSTAIIRLKEPKTLYNFAVEEDESYIATGLVSHNCRCNLSYITADERGVVQRIERYKPVDPDLLAKWSSKIYTDIEIREMVKQQKKLAPKWKEAESLDEAKEFAQDNIVKSGGAVDYGELSLESTNLLNQETYALTQTYRVKPDFLGSTQGWNRWVDKIGVYKPYKAPPVPDHVFAQMRAVSISGRRPSHVGLTLNEKYWSVAGRRNFDERLKTVIQQGWFKDGSIEVQKASLIRHEYGHVLDVDGKISQGLTEKVWQAIGTESSLKEHLGGYAAADGEREMWAELFAGYEGHRLSPALMRLVGRRLP